MFSKKDGEVKDAFFSRSSEVRRVDFGALRNVEESPANSLEEGSFVADFDPEPSLLSRIDEAYQRGVADGRAAAEEEFRASESEELELEKALMERLLAVVDDLSDQAEDAVVHLSRAFAEAILERELELPESIVNITRGAVQRACGLDKIHVYVTPSAVQILENHVHMLRPDDPGGQSLTLHPDPSLERGDIRIVSEGGHIEGILQERLERLVESAFVSISESSMGE